MYITYYPLQRVSKPLSLQERCRARYFMLIKKLMCKC